MKQAIANFFLSKKTQTVACLLGLLSLALALVCFFLPLGRQKRAVEGLAVTTLNRCEALSLSLSYYEPKRLAYLSKNPSVGPSYENIAGLLQTAQKTFAFERIYLLYQGVGGSINYLVDSAAESAEDASPYHIGSPYLQGIYDKQCEKYLADVFEGKNQGTFIPSIYENGTVISYLPVIDTENNHVMAVMGIDSRLTHTDFSRYGSFDLTTASQVFSFVAIACALVFFIGRSLALNDHDNNKNGKNGKNNFNRRYQNANLPQPKENTIVVDPLDDIDPKDYI